jgi:hypothetical protein
VIDGPLQLSLFENWMSTSACAELSSPASSEPETCSSARETSGTTSATATIPSRPVMASSTPDGAADAANCSDGASSTAGSGQQSITSISTSRSTADPMYDIPRPKTRAECRDEARPCPWVSCRHHLLIEMARLRAKDPRPTVMRLNRASSERTKLGRRAGLSSSAAESIVRAWIDDAVELLSYMPYTCALDVVEAFPDGLYPRQVGWLLGLTWQAVDEEIRKPHVKAAMRELLEHL